MKVSKCPFCGGEVNGNDAVCSRCGRKIDTTGKGMLKELIIIVVVSFILGFLISMVWHILGLPANDYVMIVAIVILVPLIWQLKDKFL